MLTCWRTSKRFVILAPHNDDEVVGCWFLMRELANRAKIRVIVVTRHDGDPELTTQRREETRTALTWIGITDVDHWDAPDGAASDYESRLEELIREEAARYDYVLCPAPNDRTPDHIPIARAAHDVVDAAKLIWYRSTWWTFTSRNADFTVTGDFADKKAALECFKSQRHIALRRSVICSRIESLLTSGRFRANEAFMFAEKGRLSNRPFNSISLRHLPRLLFWR